MLSAKVAGGLYVTTVVTGLFAANAANLVTCAGDVALVAALSVLLGPVQRHVVIIAALLRLIEIAFSATSAFRVAAIFFALGSVLFDALFYRSRYLPRLLAAFGIFASLVVLTVQSASFVLPMPGLRVYRTNLLIIAFELAAGLWLLVRPSGVKSGTHDHS